MKNKRGFTLIEVIAVIVILGLIIVIAIPFFQGSLNTFREDYYKGLETNILNSAKEYFRDNKLYLPNRYLDTQKIDYGTLVDQRYIDEVKDYNGKSCDHSNSYVIAVKTGTDKYEYATCTRCDQDDYTNNESIYCDEAWDNEKGFTEVVFDNPPDVLVYKGTSREKLKEEVIVYPDIRRCLGVGTCTKEIIRVSSKGEAGVSPIYPKDLDKVDTNRIGTYEVTYVYDLNDKDSDGNLKEKTGRVIVYGYDMKPYDPNADDNDNDIIFTKYNTVYKEVDSNSVVAKQTEVKTSRYDPANSNDWAQKLNIKFNYHGEVNGEKVLVARYQWFINGRWEDYCVPNREVNKQNNSCDATIGNVSGGFELNDDMRFRFIDVNGKVSEESTYKIRIDYTAPDTCSLQLSGTMGTRTDEAKTWYVSPKVVISFASKDDATKTSGHSGGAVKSGINYYGITKSARVQNESGEQTGDTTGITWYGYIEDKAQNFAVCQINFKKDSTVPECTKRGDNSNWTKNAVTVYWGCKDITSTCVTGEASQTFNSSNNHTTSWDAPAYDIYDKAGNHTACDSISRDIHYDTKAPSCGSVSYSDSTTSSVTVKVGCSDSGGSGCTKSTFSKTGQTSDGTMEIKDNVGNKATCAYDVYTVRQKNTRTCSQHVARAASPCDKTTCYGDWSGWSAGYCTQSTSNTTTRQYTGCVYTEEYDVCDSAGAYVCKTRTRSSYSCYTTCRDNSFECETWGPYGGWKDEACTPSSSTTTTVICQTVYRAKAK